MPVCKICGKEFKRLDIHIRKAHKISLEEYCEKFGVDRNELIDREYRKEMSRKASEAIKRKWQDPEYRNRQLNPETKKRRKEKMNKIMKEKWRDPEYRERVAKKIKEYHNRPDVRTKKSKVMKEKWQDPEYRQKVSEGVRKSWQDEEVRKKRVDGVKKALKRDDVKKKKSEITRMSWRDEEVRKKRIEGLKKYWNDEELSQEHRMKIREAVRSDEYRRKRSKIMKKIYEERPELRKKISETMRKYTNNDEYKMMVSERSRRLWQNPEYRQKVCERTREAIIHKYNEDSEYKKRHAEAMRRPEVRKKISNAMKKKWQDPGFRQRMLEIMNSPEKKEKSRIGAIRTMQKLMYKKSSNLEVVVYDILKEKLLDSGYGVYHNEVVLVFSDVWTVPDIVIMGKNNNKFLAVYIDGCFWHVCPVCGFKPESDVQKRNLEKDRLTNNTLSKYGVPYIRIWEHEIVNDLDSVIDKIVNGIGILDWKIFEKNVRMYWEVFSNGE